MIVSLQAALRLRGCRMNQRINFYTDSFKPKVDYCLLI